MANMVKKLHPIKDRVGTLFDVIISCLPFFYLFKETLRSSPQSMHICRHRVARWMRCVYRYSAVISFPLPFPFIHPRDALFSV